MLDVPGCRSEVVVVPHGDPTEGLVGRGEGRVERNRTMEYRGAEYKVALASRRRSMSYQFDKSPVSKPSRKIPSTPHSNAPTSGAASRGKPPNSVGLLSEGWP